MTNTAERFSGDDMTALEAVLSRLRGSSGFPTLSNTISDINRIVAADSHSTRQLTQAILRDVSLTTKLLQVVNSAVYGQYRGRIRTVSKAVLILGFEAVRNAAMSLMMLEFSKGRSQEKSLQDELVGAFFAGVVSRPLSQRLGLLQSEEAVICTMFQSLGRLLAIFFLYEESEQVRSLMAAGLPEEQAAEKILGVSYQELGVGVARHWNFPDRLVQGMQRLPPREVAAPVTDIDRLRIAANLANDLYTTALRTPQADKTTALQALSRRYAAAIKVDAKELIAAVDQGLREIAERAPALNLPVTHSPALNTIRSWTGDAPAPAATAQPVTESDPLWQEVGALDALENATPVDDAQHILSAGIRDVTETLTSDFKLNDVLQMVLETMYRGMSFNRTLIFIRDTRLAVMRARFGFGADVEQIIPKCSFPLAFAPDVFHVALDKGVDIVIEDAHAPKICERIPGWHHEAVNAQSFLLLPVMLRQQAIGLLYADSGQGGGIKIGAEQLGLLRTLRSQVVLAFKDCAGRSK